MGSGETTKRDKKRIERDSVGNDESRRPRNGRHTSFLIYKTIISIFRLIESLVCGLRYLGTRIVVLLF